MSKLVTGGNGMNKWFEGGGDIWTGANQGLQRFGGYFQTDKKQGGGRHTQGQWGTGNSLAYYGNVNIDPSIRAIQEQSLAKNNNLYNELGESGKKLWDNSNSLRQRYIDNGGAFSDAYVRPLQEKVNLGRGELQRNLGMRGISGSSFGDQSLQNYDVRSEMALGDARSQAEMMNLNAITGIDDQMAKNLFQRFSQQASLSQADANIAKDRLQQELSALGIGTQQQQLMIQAFEAWQSRGANNRQNIAADIIKGIGGGMGGGGGGGAS